jgi:hypothetical protein
MLLCERSRPETQDEDVRHCVYVYVFHPIFGFGIIVQFLHRGRDIKTLSGKKSGSVERFMRSKLILRQPFSPAVALRFVPPRETKTPHVAALRVGMQTNLAN